MTACVVGLALICAVAVYALDAGSDGSSADGPDVPPSALDVAWHSGELPRSLAGSGSSVRWPGRWVSETMYVYGDENGVRGYDITTGAQKWEVEPPEGAGEPCAMSPEASPGGVGAVLFDAGGDECAFLAAVDLDTGSVLWDKKLRAEYGTNVPHVHASDKHLTVALNGVESVQMFDVQSGASLDPFASAGFECAFHYVFSAAYIVAKPECRDELVVLDTENGGEPVTVPGQKGKPVRILSDFPLTVAVTVDQSDSSAMRVLNFGKYGDKVEGVDLVGTAAEAVFRDKGNGITEDGRYCFAGLATGGSDVILDLRTGKVVWEAGSTRTSFIGYDSTSESILIAEADPRKSFWTRVGAVDPGTGKVTYAGTMVATDGTYLHQSGTLYAYGGGNVVAVGDRSPDGERVVQAFDVDLPMN